MAVCTFRRVDFAERILERFDLRRFFGFVDGGVVGARKWQQIESLRSGATVTDAAVMMGNRAVDLVAARRNALHSGFVLWGYGSHDALLAHV
jgi:phosphoglycolate phosphatase